jgi:hypothetical protein
VPVSGAARMAQVNILLGVLTIEVDIVRRLAMSRASHACVPVGDIKSTRVASVPVGVMLCDVGVWHLLNGCIHSASNLKPGGLAARGVRYAGCVMATGETM